MFVDLFPGIEVLFLYRLFVHAYIRRGEIPLHDVCMYVCNMYVGRSSLSTALVSNILVGRMLRLPRALLSTR